MDNKICQNIKKVRMSYGETQEALGAEINVEKNTISYYEGDRIPRLDILSAIASYYLLTVDDFVTGDLTYTDIENIDHNLLWKNIGKVFVIITSKQAETSDIFYQSLKHHKELYNIIREQFIVKENTSLEGVADKILNLFELCIDGYYESMDEVVSEIESSVNYVSVWILYGCLFYYSPLILSRNNAYINMLKKKNKLFDDFFKNIKNEEILMILQEIKNFIFDKDNMEFVDELLVDIKKSKRGALADYLLALRYLFCMKDPDLPMEISMKKGRELMQTFNDMDNKYAKRFLDLI